MSQNKVEKIRERILKFLSNDYLSSYAELVKDPHQYQRRPKDFEE